MNNSTKYASTDFDYWNLKDDSTFDANIEYWDNDDCDEGEGYESDRDELTAYLLQNHELDLWELQY